MKFNFFKIHILNLHTFTFYLENSLVFKGFIPMIFFTTLSFFELRILFYSYIFLIEYVVHLFIYFYFKNLFLLKATAMPRPPLLQVAPTFSELPALKMHWTFLMYLENFFLHIINLQILFVQNLCDKYSIRKYAYIPF